MGNQDNSQGNAAANGAAKSQADAASHPAKVEIYTQWGCPYCVRAVNLLKAKGADFAEYDVTMDKAKREEMQARAPGARTVPQIFIGGRGIGGCDDLMALDSAGKLDPLLAAA